MTIQIRTAGALFAGVLLMSTVLPGTAFAVDGQIAITQAKAMAGGVTPGDTPGFPVTITQPGSYVLSGNLTVPDGNTTAIAISASHVTIDLNGFAILGPTDCSGGLIPCAGSGSGTGRGITTDGVQFNITVRNGTIQGMGGTGILLEGDSHLIEYMHVRSNGSGGIGVLSSADHGGSVVQNCTVQRNGSPANPFLFAPGLYLNFGIITRNIVDTNTEGIFLGSGTVSYNVISHSRNTRGISIVDKGNYIGNVSFENGIAGVIGGINQGQNLCDGVTCPGAQF